MVLNKEIVKLLIVYIVVAAVLCLVDFGGGAFGINRFAWRLGLKAFDFNNIVGLSPTVLPSISALAVYVVIGILLIPVKVKS